MGIRKGCTASFTLTMLFLVILAFTEASSLSTSAEENDEGDIYLMEERHPSQVINHGHRQLWPDLLMHGTKRELKGSYKLSVAIL